MVARPMAKLFKLAWCIAAAFTLPGLEPLLGDELLVGAAVGAAVVAVKVTPCKTSKRREYVSANQTENKRDGLTASRQIVSPRDIESARLAP